MDSEILKGMKCPNCGESMSHGYIAGHMTRLRWTEQERTQTIFSGSTLRKKIYWWGAPTVEAMRCEHCKVGIFRYDY